MSSVLLQDMMPVLEPFSETEKDYSRKITLTTGSGVKTTAPTGEIMHTMAPVTTTTAPVNDPVAKATEFVKANKALVIGLVVLALVLKD